MNSALVALLSALALSSSYYCAVIRKDGVDESETVEPFDPEGDPENLNTILKDISKYLIGDNEKLVKDIVEELNEEMSESSKEYLENLKQQFMENLSRVSGRGVLYKDARREAILKSLHSALMETTGESDPQFVVELTRRIQQKERVRKQKPKEYESNGVKSETDVDEQDEI